MHQYISLGSACNAATMIKKAGLRSASNPFDWLLNSNEGLTVVNEIIRDDFRKVSASNRYTLNYHPVIGKEIVAYLDYPTTYHVHTNPMLNQRDHQELARRFGRFRDTLRSTDSLHFVYYRNLTVCRRSAPHLTPEQLLSRMLREVGDFFSIIAPLRKGETSVLAVVEADVVDLDAVDAALQKMNPDDHMIAIARAVARHDDDERINLHWKRDWMRLLLGRTNMPFILRARVMTKDFLERSKLAVRSIFKPS